MQKAGQEAATFNDKREVHFERLIARGQNPIRIQK
jgi:acyl-[acyl-carrier-protein] desaturase